MEDVKNEERVKKERNVTGVNNHLQVRFKDIFEEPEGVGNWFRSFVQKVTKLFYETTKNLIYTILALILGPILAIAWGVVFSIISFIHIWIISPTIALCFIWIRLVYKIIRELSQALLKPIFESCGAYWSNIRIKHYKINEIPKNEEEQFLV